MSAGGALIVGRGMTLRSCCSPLKCLGRGSSYFALPVRTTDRFRPLPRRLLLYASTNPRRRASWRFSLERNFSTPFLAATSCRTIGTADNIRATFQRIASRSSGNAKETQKPTAMKRFKKQHRNAPRYRIQNQRQKERKKRARARLLPTGPPTMPNNSGKRSQTRSAAKTRLKG